jgi:hypothetical protein
VRYTHLVLPYKPELCGLLTKDLWESFDVYTLVTMDKISEVEVRKVFEQDGGPLIDFKAEGGPLIEYKTGGPLIEYKAEGGPLIEYKTGGPLIEYKAEGGPLIEYKTYKRNPEDHPPQASVPGSVGRVVILSSRTVAGTEVKEMMVRVLYQFLHWAPQVIPSLPAAFKICHEPTGI